MNCIHFCNIEKAWDSFKTQISRIFSIYFSYLFFNLLDFSSNLYFVVLYWCWLASKHTNQFWLFIEAERCDNSVPTVVQCSMLRLLTLLTCIVWVLPGIHTVSPFQRWYLVQYVMLLLCLSSWKYSFKKPNILCQLTNEYRCWPYLSSCIIHNLWSRQQLKGLWKELWDTVMRILSPKKLTQFANQTG